MTSSQVLDRTDEEKCLHNDIDHLACIIHYQGLSACGVKYALKGQRVTSVLEIDCVVCRDLMETYGHRFCPRCWPKEKK